MSAATQRTPPVPEGAGGTDAARPPATVQRVSADETPTVEGPVVRSVDRAVSAMQILAREGWAGVTDIAGELGIHKSTVYRLLATLERRGMVEQDQATQRYRLGFGIVSLASTVRSSLDLVRAARPVCERLSAATDETVNLAVLEDAEVVNIDHVNASSSRINVDWLGSHTALHCTSSGKVLLAHAEVTRREELLRASPLERYTDATITDVEVLRRDLEVTHERGFAITVGELEAGLNAVGAPVRDPDGVVMACVSVSGPSYRMTEERLAQLGPVVVEAGEEISHRLGFLGLARFGDGADVGAEGSR